MEGYRSGKQRRAEIKSARRVRRLEARKRCAMMALVPIGPVVRVDYNKLMASNSYGLSEFAQRGYYVDRAFSCCDCGAECVWTAEQQRWWYETLGGSGNTPSPKRCRPAAKVSASAGNGPASVASRFVQKTNPAGHSTDGY